MSRRGYFELRPGEDGTVVCYQRRLPWRRAALAIAGAAALVCVVLVVIRLVRRR